MKFIILTAATGGGHIQAGRAVEDYINNNTEHEAKCIDALRAINRPVNKIVCGSYSMMAKNAPKMYGKLFTSTNKSNAGAKVSPVICSWFAGALLKIINSDDYDVCVSTHPFLTEMLTLLKRKGKTNKLIVNVITDYGVHRSWVSEGVDMYVTATETITNDLLALNVPKEKIFPIGIPVFNKFFKPHDKDLIIKNIGFDKNIPIVLLMAGSLGVKNIVDIYKNIDESDCDLQIILITGNNKKLYTMLEKLTAESKKKVELIMFTNKVEEYMQISDLIVTKPGGLTVSESLACNLPLVVFDAIPGQEGSNADFLSDNNMGVQVSKGDDISQIIKDLLNDREKIKSMQESCMKFDKSKSVQTIVDTASELLQK